MSKAKNKRKNNKKGPIWPIFLFIIGLLVLLYPRLSDLYYRVDQQDQVADFKDSRQELSQEEIDERIRLAKAYNDSLNNAVSEDPFSEENLEEGIAHYAKMLEIHEKIGVVEVPAAHIELAIYAGTAPEILEHAAGHLEGTSLPIGGNSSHTLLTAHSGLPQARLFTDLHDVELGDKFYIHNIKETLAYQVDHIDVIKPSDFSQLLIVPGHDYASLLTCTPLGINSHRLIVRGHRVPYVEAVEERIIADNKASFRYQYLFYLALIIIVILCIIMLINRRRMKAIKADLKDLSEDSSDSEKILASESSYDEEDYGKDYNSQHDEYHDDREYYDDEDWDDGEGDWS